MELISYITSYTKRSIPHDGSKMELDAIDNPDDCLDQGHFYD